MGRRWVGGLIYLKINRDLVEENRENGREEWKRELSVRAMELNLIF